MKTTVIIVLSIVVVFVLLSAAAWGWRYWTAEIEGQVGARERIESADFRIEAYERFYDRCAVIQGYEAQLAAQRSQLAQTKSEAERERIRANIAGLEGQRARAIRQYNADARKDYTVGQFRDSDLPYQLSIDGGTTC